MTKTRAAKGRTKAGKRPKSLRMIALEVGRSPTTVQRWLDKGMPRECSKAKRLEWIRDNTIPPERLQERKRTRAHRGEAEAAVLRGRLRLGRHRLRARIAGFVLRTAARRAVREHIQRAVGCFANVPALLAGLLANRPQQEVMLERLTKQVDNALRSLGHRVVDDG